MKANKIKPEWRAARRILVVRLDNLGDVLVTTPAIHALKAALPAAQITLLASAGGAQAGRLNPDIGAVIVYPAPWVDPWSELAHDPTREQRMIARLRADAYDAAVIFTSFRQSSLPAAYLCYLAGIPLRLAASIDGPGSLLTTRHKHPERMMHEVERGLDLVGAIGVPGPPGDLVLQLPAAAHDWAAGFLARQSAPLRGPLVVLHPGCSMPARTYPWEMYAELADLLIERLGATVVLTGSAAERPLVMQIKAHMRHTALVVAGEPQFANFCALIAAADLTITNNTGPMHIAAALKTPVIALFALTNPPEQWGPWRVPHRLLYHDVPCRICYSRVCPFGHECLRRVRPETVVAAASSLLTAVPESDGAALSTIGAV